MRAVTTDERIDRLTGVVESLAASVVAHDNQIERLIEVAEKHEKSISRLESSLLTLERQWQAYINRLPRN
jgi:predicted  nucleic acid-binding Zn-ribbon protein